MRALGRLAGKCALEQDGNLLIVDAAGPTGTQFVIESGRAVLDEALRHLPTVAFLQRRRRAI